MCACVCVCVCVCTYIHKCICTHTFNSTRCSNRFVDSALAAFTWVCVCVCVYTYICIHTHLQLHPMLQQVDRLSPSFLNRQACFVQPIHPSDPMHIDVNIEYVCMYVCVSIYKYNGSIRGVFCSTNLSVRPYVYRYMYINMYVCLCEWVYTHIYVKFEVHFVQPNDPFEPMCMNV